MPALIDYYKCKRIADSAQFWQCISAISDGIGIIKIPAVP